MSSIIKPDPWIDFYKAEKVMNPDATIVVKQYQKRVVDMVDYLVELSHGNRENIKTDKDWRLVEEVFRVWAVAFPNEYREFRQSIPDIRSSRGQGGYSESREIKYVGAIPPRLMRMMKIIFPLQEWNKDFINKFVKKYPLFKVGGEGN